MNNIEKIVFINLEKRKDRYNEIMQEFKDFEIPEEKIERFDAIYTPGHGLLGCGKSHIGVLELAKSNNWKNVLILEDDFKIVVSKEEFYSSLEYFYKNIDQVYPWDVLMFAYNTTSPPNNRVESFHDDLKIGKIKYAQTASAYLVNNHYYDKLIENLKIANIKLEETHKHWHYANDVYWKSLQEKDNWLYFKNRLSIQRPSFSDNGNSFTNYGI